MTASDPDFRTVLVTGASGFIGRRLVSRLLEQGARVRALSREGLPRGVSWPHGALEVVRADLAAPGSLDSVCRGVGTVFHLAGYAHAEDADSEAAAARHRAVTVEGTRALLEEAGSSGVRRYVFASSVKAMGEGGEARLDETSPCQPASTYGRAKLEAERLVLEAGRMHGMHVCVLRLPLVYGPGVKGNLARMIAAVDRGRFPPLPQTNNRRSLVHVEDAVQALMLTAERDAANGQVYIVTDGLTYSTHEIYTLIRQALGKAPPRWAVPAAVLRAAAWCGDRLERFLPIRPPLTRASLDKLLGSAWYSSEKIQLELGFRPTRTLAEALPEMVAEYRRKG